jgi:hypothetical protein
LVGTDIDLAVDDPGIAGEVHRAVHAAAQDHARVDRRGSGSDIEVGRYQAQELRVGEIAVGVFAGA